MTMTMVKKWIFRVLTVIFFLIIFVPSDRIVNFKSLLGFLFFTFSGYLVLKLLKLKLESSTLLQKFIYSTVAGMSLCLVILFTLGSLGIPVFSWQIYLLAFVVTAASIYLFARDKKLLFQVEANAGSWDSIFILFILNLLLVVSFLPSNGLLTAPLHDPAHNSITSTYLMKGNFLYEALPQFASHYPPGAAYILALFGSLAGIDGAKATLIFTIFMSIFAVFSLKVFIEKYFSNKKFSNIVLLVSSLLFPYIFGLYSLAGKNSQIFAYSFLFVSLTVFYESIKEKFSWKLLLGVVVAASALTHYTNAFIFSTFALIIFVIEISNKKLKTKDILKELMMFILPIFLVGLTAFLQYRNIVTLPGTKDLSSSQINSLGPLSPLNFFRYMSEPPANVFQRLNIIFPALITFVYVAALVSSILEYKKSKGVENIKAFVLFMPLAFLPLYLFGPFKVSYFSNYHVFFFVTMILSVALYYFWNFLNEKNFEAQKRIIKVALIVLLSGYSIFAMYWLYKSNMNVRKMVAVDESDLKAFEWIDENVSDDRYFLPSAIFGFEKNQNFETDALLYIKAYTNREEVFGFVQGDKFGGAEEFRDEYFALSENLTDKEALNTFLNEGVHYVYVDSSSPLGVEYIDPYNFSDYPSVYKTIYDLDGIRIYEIIPQ